MEARDEDRERYDHYADPANRQPAGPGRPRANFNFLDPPELSARVTNLIAWWRHCEKRHGDDGSITIMADQLERALNGPSAD